MRRSSTDESTYRRSPSLESKDYSLPQAAFRRYSSSYGNHFEGQSSFFGFHTNPGPKATKTKYTSPKGNKYVVFYLDLSFIFLLELKRCSMARNCLQCIKYLMFVFNLLFWGNFATLSASFPSLSAANVLIAAGTVVMVIGFLGCIGAIKENKCLLLSFFILLLIVLLLETISMSLFFAYKEEIDRYAQADLKEGLWLYDTEGNIGLTNAWSIIQTDVGETLGDPALRGEDLWSHMLELALPTQGGGPIAKDSNRFNRLVYWKQRGGPLWKQGKGELGSL
ncbi:Tetraspanin-4 [Acipenser ruthenus]|uniref:Tetraspanin-4 n=1 Tax=Acipenser ruthenus TaxID=7906 RepID=A0A444UM06_ACIRT|nr:Tetraspanin-4 [Acipenser ruthenus]